MKHFPILDGRVYVVELPPDAELISPVNGRDRTWSYWSETEKYGTFEAPPGNWRIIGMLSEVTEEQAGMVVEKVMNGQHYQNYNYKSVIERWVKTALESLESAILAEGYSFTNPLGNEKEYKKKYKGHPMFFANHMAKWFEAQSRVLDRSRCLLLRREG